MRAGRPGPSGHATTPYAESRRTGRRSAVSRHRSSRKRGPMSWCCYALPCVPGPPGRPVPQQQVADPAQDRSRRTSRSLAADLITAARPCPVTARNTPPLNASPWCPITARAMRFPGISGKQPEVWYSGRRNHCRGRRGYGPRPLESGTGTTGRTGLRNCPGRPECRHPPRSPARCLIPVCRAQPARKERIVVGPPDAHESPDRPQAGGRAGRGARRTRSGRATSFGSGARQCLHRPVRHSVRYCGLSRGAAVESRHRRGTPDAAGAHRFPDRCAGRTPTRAIRRRRAARCRYRADLPVGRDPPGDVRRLRAALLRPAAREGWSPVTCRDWPPMPAGMCWRRRGLARPTSAR